MTAVAVEAGPFNVPADGRSLVALARSFGPLRVVTPDQVPVIRAAVDYDRALRPRWQRLGTGIHEWAEPRHYSQGRTWVRGDIVRVRGTKGWGSRAERVETYTERPHVSWRSEQHWTDIVLPAALKLRPEALQTDRGNVTAGRLLDYGRAVAQHADPGTGRRCIVRVDKLAAYMGCHKSTVQRCQAAAEALGVYVVMSPGRMLTEPETRRARWSGSLQRGMANEAALVIPHWLPQEVVEGTPSRTPKRLHDTPTSGRYSKSGNLLIVSSFGQQKPSGGETEPPPAAQHRQKGSILGPVTGSQRPRNGLVSAVQPSTGRNHVHNPTALAAARGLVAALPWLRGTQPGRIEPGLRRFVDCRRPWSPADVVAAIDEANRRLGRASMTPDLVRNAPALLAKYLRDFDVDADHPRAWMDLDQFEREPVSPTIHRNRELLAAKRAGESFARTAQGAADGIAEARAAVRAAEDRDT